jgi:hypothetical protein
MDINKQPTWLKPAEQRPTTAEEWAADQANYHNVPMTKPDGWTAEEWREHQRGYAMVLAGWPYEELCSDVPEVLQSKDFMQAWLEAQYRGSKPHSNHLKLVRTGQAQR